MPSPPLLMCLLLTVCVTLATWLELWFMDWAGNRAQSSSWLAIIMGDSRRLFANHFFVQADVYLHGGFYPTIFDTPEMHETDHMTGTAGGRKSLGQEKPEHDEHGGADAAATFLGKPRDWIDRFGRNFYPTRHSHLGEKSVADDREILPWLRLSAELDPQRLETYTVGAYWLRTMGRANEAEQFLREGLRANPGSAEILFELGRVYDENYKDTTHARNVWELALRRWEEGEAKQPEPNQFVYEEIVGRLAVLEVRETNWVKAVTYLELLRKVARNPVEIEKEIKELRQKLGPAAPGAPP